MAYKYNVTATLDNQTPYTLNYDSVSVQWGDYYNQHTTVVPNSTLEIFYACGAEDADSGCQGTVTWTFTDQNGNAQDFTLTYNDPASGPNTYSTNVPEKGMSGSYSGGGGDSASVTFTISGSIP